MLIRDIASSSGNYTNKIRVEIQKYLRININNRIKVRSIQRIVRLKDLKS